MERTIGTANMCVVHDKKENLTKIQEFMHEGAQKGVNFLVFPEMALQGYADFAFSMWDRARSEQTEYFHATAETVDGPSIQKIASWCRNYRMMVQIGFAQKSEWHERIHNSVAIIGPEGLLGTYSKTHNDFEWPYFAKGDRFEVFQTDVGAVGPLICWDFIYPESVRSVALMGASIVAKSTAWPMTGHDRSNDQAGRAHDLTAVAGALFNQVWMVTSDHTEKQVYSTKTDYWGRSQIVNPLGEVVASSEDEECLVTFTADFVGEQRKVRNGNGLYGLNLLQDRNPNLYAELVREHGPAKHPLDSQSPSVPGPGAAEVRQSPTHERATSGDEADA